MSESLDTAWFVWEGPRLRVLPILLTLFIGITIIIVSSVLGVMILQAVDANLVSRLWPVGVITQVFYFGFALLGIAIARRFIKGADFGLRWPRGRTLLGMALVSGAVFGFVMLVVDQSLARGTTVLAQAHTPVDMAGWLLLIPLVGPGEETLFRGLLLGVLQGLSPSRLRLKRFSISTAGVTIAVMFALAHLSSFASEPWPAALGQQLYAIAGGILLAWLRENSGSLLAPMVAHITSDFIETAAIFGLAALSLH
jgi:uncharacterized protein